MRFIKKLVILTGSGAHGTLMIEKNGFGVWCKLTIFDLKPVETYRFAIISGDDLFVMKLDPKKWGKLDFGVGELNFDRIHAVVVGDNSVIMYGSNCAERLAPDTILARVRRYTELFNSEKLITFSGKGKSIDEYFKEIAPPEYNDFAIAERNYYPAYITAQKEDEPLAQTTQEESADLPKMSKEDERRTPDHVSKAQSEESFEPLQIRQKENTMGERKPTPHELEQKYLQLIEAAATLISKETVLKDNAKPAKVEKQTSVEGVSIYDMPKPKLKNASDDTKLTQAEKPEVIAMARRITLRDYRVQGAKATGRKATFFERSSAELNKLMSTSERFPTLERLIPGSKFVRVNYDNKRFYVVGVIGSDYICYGVPAVYSEVPPDPLAGYAKWLPLSAEDPLGNGFWLMYQDGVSGETLKSQ